MPQKLLASLIASAFVFAPTITSAGGPTDVAAEPEVAEAIPAATAPDWSGLYVGIAAARPNGENFFAERSVPNQSGPDDFSGTLPTFSVGYDWQRSNLVYGVVLSVSGGDITANPVDGPVFNCSDCETALDSLATLRGRLGWSLGKTLVYGTVGAARAHGLATADAGAIVVGDESLTGWAAGLGVEHYVGTKITVSAEYLQTDFGRMELPDNCGVDCYTDISFGLLKLGVNYRW